MARHQNRKLWDGATPLGDAWLSFASDETRQRLANCPSALETLKYSSPKAQNIWEWFSAISEASQFSLDRLHIEKVMKDALLIDLFNGNLNAVGYCILPSRSSIPRAISADFFQFAKIGWDDNSAEYEGKRYVKIRVFDPDADDGISIPRKGRPGSGSVILAVIAELMAHPDFSFCNLPRKAACEMIRQKIGHDEVSGNGLSDKNLSKHIVAQCESRAIKSNTN